MLQLYWPASLVLSLCLLIEVYLTCMTGCNTYDTLDTQFLGRGSKTLYILCRSLPGIGASPICPAFVANLLNTVKYMVITASRHVIGTAWSKSDAHNVSDCGRRVHGLRVSRISQGTLTGDLPAGPRNTARHVCFGYRSRVCCQF
jgi:hypothetical protein